MVNTQSAPNQSALAAFDEYRSLLFSIAYRMIGTIADAEDMVQEAFLRWQAASREDVRSVKAFLVAIVSRLSINHLQSARLQREQYVGQWLPEPMVTDPANDPSHRLSSDESLSMAFLVLLEKLTPVERAVFLLREVFDYDYAEIAEAVGRTEANCRQILRRAKEHVHSARPRFTASALEHQELLAEFLRTTDDGDLDGLVALLANEVTLHTDGGGKAAALPNVIYGAGNVGRAILGGIKKFAVPDRTIRVLEINGAAGIVIYVDGQPRSALMLHTADRRIQGIYFVNNPTKLAHLPPARS